MHRRHRLPILFQHVEQAGTDNSSVPRATTSAGQSRTVWYLSEYRQERVKGANQQILGCGFFNGNFSISSRGGIRFIYRAG